MKTLVILSLIFILITPIVQAESDYYDSAHYQYNAPLTNVPNCVVGAFCMLANDKLNIKTSPNFWRTNEFTKFDKYSVDMNSIEPGWNKTFKHNPLVCIYKRPLISTTNYFKVKSDYPYLWITYLVYQCPEESA